MKTRLIYPVLALFVLGACTSAKPEINGDETLPGTPVESESEMTDSSTLPTEQDIEGAQETMWIGPELVDCVGVAPQQCMLVKWEQDADWSMFYDHILGFAFEPGYEYQLIVEKRAVENPPADSSSIQWLLVEITNQTQVGEKMDVPGLGNTGWMLVDLGQPLLDGTQIMITFDLDEMQVSGNSGCNAFFGKFTLDENQVSFGPLASTRKACLPKIMDQENYFLRLLDSTEAYQISENQLKLTTPDGQTLVFAPMDIE